MRYQPDHKERTRRQIVSAAATQFRKNGVVATGVVGLMKEAGLTQGGFYAHFDSKEALVREATTAAMLETAGGLATVAQAAGEGADGLGAVIDAYLSMRHLDRPERGCAIATVGAELARESAQTRHALMEAAGHLLSLIEGRLTATIAEPRRTAQVVVGLLSGTLQLARLAVDRSEASAILEAGRQAAKSLCRL